MNGWNKFMAPTLAGAFSILLAATVMGVWSAKEDIASIKATQALLYPLVKDVDRRLRMVEITGGVR